MKYSISHIESTLQKTIRSFFLEHRMRLYVIIVLFIALVIGAKIPYINILLVPFKSVLLFYLIILALTGWNWRSFLLIGVLLFILIGILLLLGKDSIAEMLANEAYLNFITAVILIFWDLIRR